jgi:hypothetical protein
MWAAATAVTTENIIRTENRNPVTHNTTHNPPQQNSELSMNNKRSHKGPPPPRARQHN